MGPRYFDTKTIARRASFHTDTIRKLRIKGGGPPYAQVGTAIRYDVELFDAWMTERTFRHQGEELAEDPDSDSD